MDSRRVGHRRLARGLVILIASLLAAAPASADPSFVAKFAGNGPLNGGAGTGAGQLVTPRGIAIDGADNIYIADQNNNRIDEFSTTGAFVKAWGWGVATGTAQFETCTTTCQTGTSGYGVGQLSGPVGIATDAAGDVYVGEGSARVSEFSSTGTFIHAFGWGVINGASAFQVCTTTCQIGGSGSGAGEFQSPFGLALDASGNILVTDQSGQRVNEFSPTPAFTKAWGWGVATGASQFETCTSTCLAAIGGGGAGQFGGPIGIAVDQNGNIYVPDNSLARVSEFTPGGLFTKAWGWSVLDGLAKLESCTTTCQSGQGSGGAGAMFEPWGAELDAAGNIWVVDQGNDRIDEFDRSGNFRLAFGYGVGNQSSNTFQVCRATCLAGIPGNGDGQFQVATDLAFDSSGDLYVVDSFNARVERFAVGHNLDVTVGGTGSGSVSGTSIACPSVCSASYPSGTGVTLTATPATGSTFAGWSGACTGTGTCDVTMDGDKAATATFNSSSTGSGTGAGSGGTTAPTGGTAGAAAPTSQTVPPPVEFKNGNAEPVTGSILVKLPGTKSFVAISQITQIPVGSIVDARHGRVRLTIDAGGGKTATADFYEGEFQFLQRGTKQAPVALIVLTGGSFGGCPRSQRAALAAKKPKSIRHLWADGNGAFRTQGRFAAATIRGTTWDTDDSCAGTLVKVTKGAVTVSDLVKRKSVALKAGHQYLAQAPRTKRR